MVNVLVNVLFLLLLSTWVATSICYKIYPTKFNIISFSLLFHWCQLVMSVISFALFVLSFEFHSLV